MAGLNLAIFGGTFDPPHIGHLILAAEALAQLALDRVLWVLTPDPPHKTNQRITTLEIRLEMLRLALANDDGFELSAVDINRPPPHYALDTLHMLRQIYPGARLNYLMGADSLIDLPNWRRPNEFVSACDAIAVMQRPGSKVELHSLEAILPGLSSRTLFLEAPLIEISSSQLRQRIARNLPYRYFLPSEVYNFIQRGNLYRDPGLETTNASH